MKKTLYNVALYGSLLYVVLVVLSFILTRQLPSFHEAGAEREYICYWRSTLLPFYECGEQAIASGLRDSFYNFYLVLGYILYIWVKAAPDFLSDIPNLGIGDIVNALRLIGLTLVFYAPLFFLVFAFVRWIVRKLKGGHGA